MAPMKLRHQGLTASGLLILFCTLSLTTELPSIHFFVAIELIVGLVVLALYVDVVYSYWKLRQAQIINKKKPSFSLLILALFGLIAFFGIVMMEADASIRRNSIVSDALNLLAQSKAGQDALGSEIRAGWPIQGEWSIEGDNGQASLAIPVSGKHSHRTMYVKAKKSGLWSIESLELSANASRIQILQAR
jgi:hypothetical protein